ncbi:suppressor of SWI4 1 homolog isoform X1 [Sceloporus undulatus]|uniref:suppressor of SWI4 1 homolog isoform X1 n=1 Tax=Sceloporus undulatus TaxID=8520 RepID=UPI001C4D935C|nr:suppressor of SWI4 1 homolog isoform X1 [Sceloporus undulatus]
MGKSGKTKNQKKERAAAQHRAQEEYGSVPHSFVFHRGRVGKNLQQLILDVRRVMQPYTATSLKVRKKNSLKDFVTIAGPLGITHFLVFTKTSSTINLKLFRLPGGPTLTFRVTQYSLIKDVVSSLKRHRMHEQQFTHHPLLVLNNFGIQGMHIKVMATMFQNMFPSINVHKVNLNAIKRCVLINYNSDNQTLEFRHYSLKVVPVGMSKGLKKLLQERFPNMNRLEDISDLLVRDINLSESEAEQDGSHNITELPQAYAGRGNMKAQQSAVRLTEIGPRMTLQLIKVEEGLGQGNVLYHSFIHKTDEEILEALAKKEGKLQLKAERRRKQEADVAHKQKLKEAHRKKSIEGIKRKKKEVEGNDSDAEDPGTQEDQNAEEQSDDDMEYYRQEVGEEPDEDLFPQSAKRKRVSHSTTSRKRLKRTPSEGGQSPAFTGTTSKLKHRKKTPQPGQRPRQHFGQWPMQRPKQRPGQHSGPQQRDTRGQQEGSQGAKHRGQHKSKRQPRGSSMRLGARWQGKSGLGRKVAQKGKGAFRKLGRSGKKRPT